MITLECGTRLSNSSQYFCWDLSILLHVSFITLLSYCCQQCRYCVTVMACLSSAIDLTASGWSELESVSLNEAHPVTCCTCIINAYVRVLFSKSQFFGLSSTQWQNALIIVRLNRCTCLLRYGSYVVVGKMITPRIPHVC